MNIDLTEKEVEMVSQTIYRIFIVRGGGYTITNDDVRVAIDLVEKLTGTERNELIKVSNNSAEIEQKTRDILEEQNHPFRTFWRRLWRRK